jgi:hypothetical protein
MARERLTALVTYSGSRSIPAASRPCRGPAGGSHERLSGPVLLITGLFADHHHVRGARPGTEHGLLGVRV